MCITWLKSNNNDSSRSYLSVTTPQNAFPYFKDKSVLNAQSKKVEKKNIRRKGFFLVRINCLVTNQYMLHTNGHCSSISNHKSSCNFLNYNVEYTHFKKRSLNNITIHNIQNQFHKRLFLQCTYIKHYNTLYPHGLNQLSYNNSIFYIIRYTELQFILPVA